MRTASSDLSLGCSFLMKLSSPPDHHAGYILKVTPSVHSPQTRSGKSPAEAAAAAARPPISQRRPATAERPPKSPSALLASQAATAPAALALTASAAATLPEGTPPGGVLGRLAAAGAAAAAAAATSAAMPVLSAQKQSSQKQNPQKASGSSSGGDGGCRGPGRVRTSVGGTLQQALRIGTMMSLQAAASCGTDRAAAGSGSAPGGDAGGDRPMGTLQPQDLDFLPPDLAALSGLPAANGDSAAGGGGSRPRLPPLDAETAALLTVAAAKVFAPQQSRQQAQQRPPHLQDRQRDHPQQTPRSRHFRQQATASVSPSHNTAPMQQQQRQQPAQPHERRQKHGLQPAPDFTAAAAAAGRSSPSAPLRYGGVFGGEAPSLRCHCLMIKIESRVLTVVRIKRVVREADTDMTTGCVLRADVSRAACVMFLRTSIISLQGRQPSHQARWAPPAWRWRSSGIPPCASGTF